MPVYRIRALTPAGKTINDKIEAPNPAVVAEKLERQGYMPLQVKREKGRSLNANIFGSAPRVKTDDVIVFTRQAVTLLRAGVPLLQALNALADQTENATLRETIEQIASDIEGGQSFSEALSRHPKTFHGMYVNSIRAGEMGGALDDVMGRMADLMEYDRETRARIKSAMRYPIMVLVSLVIAFIALMLLVVPRFIDMFQQLGVELPLPTRILILLHHIIANYWYAALGGLMLLFIAFKAWVKTANGRLHWDHIKLKIPVFGQLILKSSMSRFTRMFETLNRSGLPILQTLEIVSRVVGNAVVGKEIQKAILGVRKGEGIALPLKQSKLFPPMVIRMISIGEQSGSLDEMLENISRHYDMEVDYAVKNLTSMIEPMLTVVLGVIVLFLALAIFLPMWDLTRIAG